jgi:hypothetical protein
MTTVRKFTEKDRSSLVSALEAIAVFKLDESRSQNDEDRFIRQLRLNFANYLKDENISRQRAHRQAKIAIGGFSLQPTSGHILTEDGLIVITTESWHARCEAEALELIGFDYNTHNSTDWCKRLTEKVTLALTFTLNPNPNPNPNPNRNPNPNPNPNPIPNRPSPTVAEPILLWTAQRS